ncbi:MAG: hypothetical protein CMJ75_18820 [Planctomycetaceae bacterium]|nr:hypothetical protein [Planctomycetaceae bacterium]
MQTPLFQPESEWRAPDLASLPEWKGAKRIGLDTETADPQLRKLGIGVRRDGRIVGVSFAIEGGPGPFYLPTGHAGGGNLPAESVYEYLRRQAAEYTGEIVGANLQYDLDYLAELGIIFRRAKMRDVQIAAPLIYEMHDSYSLASIAGRYDIPGKDESLLKEAGEAWGLDPKKGLHHFPARLAGPYAEHDAVLPLQIYEKQRAELDEQDLWGIFDLESALLPVLVKMRRRGVRVDFDHLDRVDVWSAQEEAKALQRVYDLTGKRIAVGDVWKAKAIAPALVEIGVKLNYNANKIPSVTKELLGSIDHPVADAINRARRVNKVRTTFADSIRKHAVNGRVHTTFNQIRRTDDDENSTGAAYGRLSSVDPNLQQQPARDPEIGPFWRAVYVPDEGAEWAALDYSQQEPRMIIHWAERAGIRAAFEAGDAFRSDPSTDNHAMMTRLIHGAEACAAMEPDEFDKKRKHAKNIFLGRCYGMGDPKLCHSIGVPTEWVRTRTGRVIEVAGPEGKAIIEAFNAGVPYVDQLSEKLDLAAQKRGYVKTILGRRCHFPFRNGHYDWTHKALNRLIQGSSADQTKLAMVEADAAGIPIQLQVHDEIDLSVSDRKVATDLAEIMENCVQLTVPSKVDIEIGDSWGGSME